MMFHVTDKVSVCGFSGISDPEEFLSYGFNAHFQCVTGYDEWISDYADVKMLPFDDCVPIQTGIMDSAYSWLITHLKKNHRVLISCSAGESRSVSIAIGLLTLSAQISFIEVCRKVFSVIPNAYPHPRTLLSVASYCKRTLKMEQVIEIYEKLVNQPPFPWRPSELEEAYIKIMTI